MQRGRADRAENIKRRNDCVRLKWRARGSDRWRTDELIQQIIDLLTHITKYHLISVSSVRNVLPAIESSNPLIGFDEPEFISIIWPVFRALNVNGIAHISYSLNFNEKLDLRQLSTGEEFALQEGRILCKQHFVELIEGENGANQAKQKTKRVRTTFAEEQLQILQVLTNFQIC